MGATNDTEFFFAISDPVRRALLEELRHGPQGPVALAGKVGLSKRAVASHLKILHEAGWVSGEADGPSPVFAATAKARARLLHWVYDLQPIQEVNALPVDSVESRARVHELEWPGGDADTYRIGQRLLRLATHVERSLREIAGYVNLLGAELLMLDALRLSGEPYASSPTQLQKSLLMTAGGITKCIDRLEKMGLVQRRADPADGRGVVVTMTRRAHELLNDLVAQGHLGIDSAAAAKLPPDRRALLGHLLHELAVLADAELERRSTLQPSEVRKPRIGRPAQRPKATATAKPILPRKQPAARR